jgi:sugar-specific transcriptional regulator TrmB
MCRHLCYNMVMIEKDKLKNDLEVIFQSLDLDEKSAEFYLNCLINGKTTINQISKNIGVARSTCYLIMERLKFLGLILETPFGKKRSLIAQSPDKIIGLLEKKKKDSELAFELAKSVLPAVKLYSSVDTNTKIRFYEGFESIKQIYNETLEAKLIYVFCLTHVVDKRFKEFIDNYMNRLIKKGIKTREIVTDGEDDLEYKREFSTKLNTIICIPEENITDTDYMLWDNKVAFISFKKGKYTGIVIDDQEIANFERHRFELLWHLFTKKN